MTVTWSVVMVEHPWICNLWSKEKRPFLNLYRILLKFLVDTLSLGHKFFVDNPPTVKKTWTFFSFLFLSVEEIWQLALSFCFGIKFKYPRFITSEHTTEETWIILISVQKFKKHILLIDFVFNHFDFCPEVQKQYSSDCLSVQLWGFGTILTQTLNPQCDKRVKRFKFSSQLIILNVTWRTDLTRALTRSTMSSVLDAEGLQLYLGTLRNCLWHRNTCALVICSPQTRCIFSQVKFAYSPNLTQNLMTNHCWKFCRSIFCNTTTTKLHLSGSIGLHSYRTRVKPLQSF